MADEAITSDTANIPYINVVNQSTDQTAPAAGRAIIYVKDDIAYVRVNGGSPVPVGGAVALAEGQLAIGDGDGELSALALGTEGQVVTADASGFAVWDDAPATSFVGVRYNSNAAQNIVNNTTPAIVNFEDQVYDSGGGSPLVTTGASWKFTAPTTGYYHLDVLVTFAGSTGWTAVERGLLQVYVDGTIYAALDRKDDVTSGANALIMVLKGSITLALTATHYVDVRIAQNSGGDIALSNAADSVWINIEQVG